MLLFSTLAIFVSATVVSATSSITVVPHTLMAGHQLSTADFGSCSTCSAAESTLNSCKTVSQCCSSQEANALQTCVSCLVQEGQITTADGESILEEYVQACQEASSSGNSQPSSGPDQCSVCTTVESTIHACTDLASCCSNKVTKEVEDCVSCLVSNGYESAADGRKTLNDYGKLCEDLADGESTGTSSPGTSSPGTSSPGTSSPGTSSPGTSSPGTSSPGTSSPGTSSPNSFGSCTVCNSASSTLQSCTSADTCCSSSESQSVQQCVSCLVSSGVVSSSQGQDVLNQYSQACQSLSSSSSTGNTSGSSGTTSGNSVSGLLPGSGSSSSSGSSAPSSSNSNSSGNNSPKACAPTTLLLGALFGAAVLVMV